MYSSLSSNRSSPPQSACVAGKPTRPSAPPVTDLSWLTAALVSSPTASVIMSTVVPRARITAGPVTAENTAAASAESRICTGPTVQPAAARLAVVYAPTAKGAVCPSVGSPA